VPKCFKVPKAYKVFKKGCKSFNSKLKRIGKRDQMIKGAEDVSKIMSFS